MKMTVAMSADHGGLALKGELAARLREEYEVLDLGAHVYDSGDDYPDYVLAVGRAVTGGQAGRGIIICGSGVGASIAANKMPGIRAGLCHDTYSARQGVEHDDMNILCLGARVIGIELAAELAQAFLAAGFTGEPRHRRRLEKMLDIERNAGQGRKTG